MHYKRKECETKTREKNEWDAKAERGRTCLTLSKILEDVTGTFIHKTDGKDPKNRENYWTRTLKTLAPDGLNTEDCV